MSNNVIDARVTWRRFQFSATLHTPALRWGYYGQVLASPEGNHSQLSNFLQNSGRLMGLYYGGGAGTLSIFGQVQSNYANSLAGTILYALAMSNFRVRNYRLTFN